MESDAEAEAFRNKSKQEYRDGMNGHGTVPPPLSDEARKELRLKTLEEKAPLLTTFMDDAIDLARRRRDGIIKPLKTPWDGLNKSIGGGFWPGLYVLIGSTGEGKTQLACQAALEVAMEGTPVLYAGLECDRSEMSCRFMALLWAMEARGGRSPKWSSLYRGDSGESDADIARYRDMFRDLPIHMELAPPFGWAPSELLARVEMMRDLYPETDGPGTRPILAVVDYLQIISAEADSRHDLRERISKATYAGKTAASRYGVSVLVLSSTSRQSAKEKDDGKTKPWENDGRMYVGSGKESGEIEYSADAVLLLQRAEWLDEEKKSRIHLAISKQRAGKAGGWHAFKFDGNIFEEDTHYRYVGNTGAASRVKKEGRRNYIPKDGEKFLRNGKYADEA